MIKEGWWLWVIVAVGLTWKIWYELKKRGKKK